MKNTLATCLLLLLVVGCGKSEQPAKKQKSEPTVLDTVATLQKLGARVTRVDTEVLKVDFAFAGITDDDLVHLTRLKDHGSFKHLDLNNNKITDAGLVHIKSLKYLTSLSLKGTLVTDDGEAELKKALPDCGIYR